MGLNARQLLFVKEYLIDKNATRAAKAAGYTGSDSSLASIGSENLRKLDIAQAIQEGLSAQRKDAEGRAAERGITRDRWLKKLEQIAFANMDDFAVITETIKKIIPDEDEKDFRTPTTIATQHVKLVTTVKRRKGLGQVIKKLSETQTQHGGSVGIELHNPLPALEMIGRAYGWLEDEDAPPIPTASNVQVIITLPSNGRELKVEKSGA